MVGPGIGLEIVLQEICHRRYRIYQQAYLVYTGQILADVQGAQYGLAYNVTALFAFDVCLKAPKVVKNYGLSPVSAYIKHDVPWFVN